jgi:hypothetical protein
MSDLGGKFRVNHPNDVIAKDGWHVVRNERSYDMYGDGNKRMIWYNTYHYHEGIGLNRCTVSPSVSLVREGEITLTPHMFCRSCSTEVPEYIQGFLKMIAWSERDED